MGQDWGFSLCVCVCVCIYIYIYKHLLGGLGKTATPAVTMHFPAEVRTRDQGFLKCGPRTAGSARGLARGLCRPVTMGNTVLNICDVVHQQLVWNSDAHCADSVH
jgi:hypothetical protein